jgi:tyrosyl-tRNA synthetase
MNAVEFLRLASMVTHARLLERDMFQERIKQQKEIFVSEFLYPILQGYDSVAIRSDLTIIGSDQLFNEHMGRFFQEKFGQAPQSIVTLKILPGPDGREKMSKSLGNYIGLEDSPQDKFGKAMRLLDSLIVPYLESYTDVPIEKIRGIARNLAQGENPMQAKLFFAGQLVRRYHGRNTAARERERFLEIYSRKELPEKIPGLTLRHGSWDPVELLVATKLVVSKSEARRLLTQGALEVDGRRIVDSPAGLEIRSGTVLKIGKRRFIRVK